MRFSHIALLLLPLILPCCGKGDTAESTSENNTPEVAVVHAPPGDPATLPKVPGDQASITQMLGSRFGDAITRNIRVEVTDQGAGKRVSLSGEVPNEEIRQAVMKELEARVPEMKSEDFTLDLAGPLRRVTWFDAYLRDPPIVFTPDLSEVVTREGYIYETATGRRINRIVLPKGYAPQAMAVSPDGKILAMGFQLDGLFLYELPLVRNPKPLSHFSDDVTNSGYVSALQFTSDGKHLVGINSRRGEVVMWNLATGVSRTIGAHVPRENAHRLGEYYVVAVSPDTSLIASAAKSEYKIRVWDAAARSLKFSLDATGMHPNFLAWSHDGKMLAVEHQTANGRGVGLVDIATRKVQVLSQDGPDDLIQAVAFSPDDRTLAVYQQRGLYLWDLPSGKVWRSVPSEKLGTGHALAFSRDGNALALSCEGLNPTAIRLYDVSGRPGGKGGVAQLPPPIPVAGVHDDKLADAIEHQIRDPFPQSVETLHVEILPDGTIEITGKVANQQLKDNATLHAETTHPDEPGNHNRNKVINKLEVTGRYKR